MKKKSTILNIVGARPNFMKIAPIVAEMNNYPEEINHLLIHTGQHYDEAMSKSFFDDLDIPRPDIDLEVGSGSHAEQTARIMTHFEKVLLTERPDLILVVGDVNSTLACSVTAAKLCVPVAHVEAGLRSYDRTMPEEINRIVTDALSDYLFTTERSAGGNLLREGIPEEKQFFVGNVMIDTLLKHREKAATSTVRETNGIGDTPYALLTLHRPSNVDNRDTFMKILAALKSISRDIPIIFPAHPRTKKQIELFGLADDFRELGAEPLTTGIYSLPPVGYLDFLHLMENARLLLTDSGGIQEETTILGVPCITMRENTERPVTITDGTNTLVGTDTEKIVHEARQCLGGKGKAGRIPELWDGKASERIVAVLKEKLAAR